MTTNPDARQMMDQTSEAVRESVAPLADMVVRNAIAEEFTRAYSNAMSDLVILSEPHERDPWKNPEPVKLVKVIQGEISE